MPADTLCGDGIPSRLARGVDLAIDHVLVDRKTVVDPHLDQIVAEVIDMFNTALPEVVQV
jgi:hypothetical protein